MRRPRVLIGCAAIVWAFVAVAAAGQTVEIRGGLVLANPGVDSSFTTNYTPTLVNSTDSSGHAGEQVSLGSPRPRGLEGAVGVFFSPHAGLEVTASWLRTDLDGRLGDYGVTLDYTSRQPPDYTPKPYTSSTVAPGGARLSGSLTHLTLSAAAVGRWALSPRLTAHLSGGLSYARASGHADPLDYTVFHMGGHSVLMSDSYKLQYDLEATHTVALTVGGGLDVTLAPWLALAADARYIAAADVDMPIVVSGVDNTSEIYLGQQDVAVIQQTLRPGSVKVSPSRARFVLGLKIRR